MGHEIDSIQASRDLVSQGRRTEAIELLNKALTAWPEDGALFAEKGLNLCYMQREDEALECLHRAWPHESCKPLITILGHYGFARLNVAKKLGVGDPTGKAFWNRIQCYLPPETTFINTKISAILITKDESANLARCLKSIQGRVDEIIVVDTGSTDDTLAIAETFGATIGFHAWNDDFSAARNASLELATGDWALWIDADEAVDEGSWPSIWEAIIRPQFGGYFMPIVNFTDEAENCQYTHAPIRLFRILPEIRFENKIHEQISPSIDRLGLPTATLDNTKILHYGYKPSAMEAKQKIQRTISMLETQVEESPSDAFHWFNLANALSVAQRYEESGVAARKCLDLLDPGNNYGSLTFQLLQGAYNSIGKAEEALDVALECKRAGFFTILNQFELAHTFYLLRRFDDALTAIDACMNMAWPNDMTGDKGIVTHKNATLKGQILSELGRLDEAMDQLDASLKVDPNFGLTIFAKALTLERQGHLKNALDWYHKSLSHPAVSFATLKSLSRVCGALEDYDAAVEYGRAALEASPEDKEAWSYWAQGIEGHGDLDARIEAYARYTELHGDHPDVLTNWGRALCEKGEYDSSHDVLQRAIQANASNTNAWLNLADLYYKCGAFAQAVQAYDSALRLDSTDVNAWFCLGNSAGRLGAWEAAKASFEQALLLDPNHGGSRHNLAVALEEMNQAA